MGDDDGRRFVLCSHDDGIYACRRATQLTVSLCPCRNICVFASRFLMTIVLPRGYRTKGLHGCAMRPPWTVPLKPMTVSSWREAMIELFYVARKWSSCTRAALFRNSWNALA